LNNIEKFSPAGLLLVGKVIRPHGLKGLLLVLAYAGSDTSFWDAVVLFLKSVSGKYHKYVIASVKPHKNGFLMKLEGLNSIEAAEVFRDAGIYVQKDTLTRKSGQWFFHELIGLKVYLVNGEYLGNISQIIFTGSHDLYVVKRKTKEIFIPATYEVVKKIDLEKGEIIVSVMDGLLDLNEV